jgi:predicted transposase YbfD/YdcC
MSGSRDQAMAWCQKQYSVGSVNMLNMHCDKFLVQCMRKVNIAFHLETHQGYSTAHTAVQALVLLSNRRRGRRLERYMHTSK